MIELDISEREKNEIEHYKTKAITFDKDAGHDNDFADYKKAKKIDEFVNTVFSFFESEEKLEIVELCSGTGEFTSMYAPILKKSRIVGFDLSADVVEIAKAKCSDMPNTSFIVKSAYQTDIKDESVDVVCIFYGLHHLDLIQASKEIYRILKKGGIAFFCEPNELNPYVYLVYHNSTLRKMYDLTPDEWLVNPLKIKKQFPEFEVYRLKTMEFMLPLKFLSLSVFKFFDILLSKIFNIFPGFKLVGGTITFTLRK